MSDRHLFLDIDGVLNHASSVPGTFEPELCRRLTGLLVSLPDLLIVLSTSWRYMVYGGAMTLRGFEYMLMSHGIPVFGRIVGLTDKDELYGTGFLDMNVRVRQVRDWLKKNAVEGQWAVMDDMPLDFGDDGERFVQVDGSIGLADGDVDHARWALSLRAVS